MALVQCIECGANISDRAKSCPKCGCPEPFKKEEFGNCIECLAKIPLNSLSCPNCGHPNLFEKQETVNAPIMSQTQKETRQVRHDVNMKAVSGGYYDVSEELVSKINFVIEPTEDKILVGGLLKRKIEFVMIIIPLWFNIHWTYVFFTMKRMILCERTLWGGLKEPIFLDYQEIDSITYEAKRGFWSGQRDFHIQLKESFTRDAKSNTIHLFGATDGFTDFLNQHLAMLQTTNLNIQQKK